VSHPAEGSASKITSPAAASVEAFLQALPPQRAQAVEAVRKVILRNLPSGYREMLRSRFISYEIPLGRYPNTYNGRPLQVAALASQKQHMSLYLMAVYARPEFAEWFTARYRKSGKTLRMGKSCVRFKSLDDLALDVIAEAIRRVPVTEYVKFYEAARNSPSSRHGA
jgi:hypothetical protein